ncbi:hypothetical protein [Mesorhizobium sp. B1-1-7]|uniref:hypothetical protein n=1 Tax=Mesorhizobium sp. B1-1-7 TaxID=2589977 RepID=UPI001125B522|nr:hypothetical protein [Mesorhizobium sp. B1-1-7]TPN49350.1 hypothetical protein FJ978_19325 [Mesorhizobium sp. B1-1-7]
MKTTVFLAMTPKLRLQLATTIENLIALLDEVDGDADLEDDAADEPSLGWNDINQPGGVDDRELDSCDDEDCHDREPTMSGSNSIDQTHAYRGSSHQDECEEENEHGGDVLDEPHDANDQGDDEPSMGWAEKCGQAGVGVEDMDILDSELLDPYASPLDFTGQGHDEARQLLGHVYRKHNTQPPPRLVQLRRS